MGPPWAATEGQSPCPTPFWLYFMCGVGVCTYGTVEVDFRKIIGYILYRVAIYFIIELELLRVKGTAKIILLEQLAYIGTVPVNPDK